MIQKDSACIFRKRCKTIYLKRFAFSTNEISPTWRCQEIFHPGHWHSFVARNQWQKKNIWWNLWTLKRVSISKGECQIIGHWGKLQTLIVTMLGHNAKKEWRIITGPEDSIKLWSDPQHLFSSSRPCHWKPLTRWVGLPGQFISFHFGCQNNKWFFLISTPPNILTFWEALQMTKHSRLFLSFLLSCFA